jgi:hypothetical protein
MSAATQLTIEAAATGNIMREYISSGGANITTHIASMHNAMYIMDRTTGQLVIQLNGEEIMRADIMNVASVAGATPALRFTALANSLTT